MYIYVEYLCYANWRVNAIYSKACGIVITIIIIIIITRIRIQVCRLHLTVKHTATETKSLSVVRLQKRFLLAKLETK